MEMTRHPLAGETVRLAANMGDPVLDGAEYRVEDTWRNVSGGSWMFAQGNPACIKYAMRTGFKGGIPLDNDVLWGKVGPFGHLVHASEIVSD